jgi:hypothetical protein
VNVVRGILDAADPDNEERSLLHQRAAAALWNLSRQVWGSLLFAAAHREVADAHEELTKYELPPLAATGTRVQAIVSAMGAGDVPRAIALLERYTAAGDDLAKDIQRAIHLTLGLHPSEQLISVSEIATRLREAARDFRRPLATPPVTLPPAIEARHRAAAKICDEAMTFELGSVPWRQAWRMISVLEEEIASIEPRHTVEGKRARMGAIEAAGASGDTVRAQQLADTFFSSMTASIRAGRSIETMVDDWIRPKN